MIERTGQLECEKCGHFHLFEDRVPKKVDVFTCYYCPMCGEESYIQLDTSNNKNLNKKMKR